jgi:hypothetical protein
MRQATPVVTQPNWPPANMVGAMPTLLGSSFRNNSTVFKLLAPDTITPDCCEPAPKQGARLTTAADVEINTVQDCVTLALGEIDVAVRTSLLLRNLPGKFVRSKVLDVLHAQGLATKVDFLYTPGSLKHMQACGYAFVNFTTPEAAMECFEKMHGYSWDARGEKVCEASWCDDHQGLESHVERHRNSTIMHESVDDEYKPALFSNGLRIPFPLPSKRLRKPRLRKFSMK